MTDSNYSGNVDINIDPEYADYLADEAEQAQDEYEQAREHKNNLSLRYSERKEFLRKFKTILEMLITGVLRHL